MVCGHISLSLLHLTPSTAICCTTSSLVRFVIAAVVFFVSFFLQWILLSAILLPLRSPCIWLCFCNCVFLFKSFVELKWTLCATQQQRNMDRVHRIHATCIWGIFTFYRVAVADAATSQHRSICQMRHQFPENDCPGTMHSTNGREHDTPVRRERSANQSSFPLLFVHSIDTWHTDVYRDLPNRVHFTQQNWVYMTVSDWKSSVFRDSLPSRMNQSECYPLTSEW